MRNRSKKLIILLSVVPALLSAVSSLASAPAPTPEDYEVFYLGLYREIAVGDLSKAVETYRRIVTGPLAATELGGFALIRLGICFEKMGEPAEAVNCYDRAIVDFSDRVSVLELASEGVMRLYPQPAGEVYEKKELSGLISRGLRKLEEGEPEAAIEILEKAYGLNPDNSYLQLRLAAAYKELGRFQEAIYYYNLAASSSRYRYDFSLYKEISACHRLSGRPEAALQLWELFLQLESPERIAKDKIGYELELIYEAIDYPPGMSIPEALGSYLREGERNTRERNYQAAAAIYRAARAKFPGSYLPPARLARLHEYFLADSETAYWYYKEAISKAPEVPAQRLRCRLAFLSSKMGEQEKTDAVMKEYFSRSTRPRESDTRVQAWLDRWESWLKRKKAQTKSSRILYPRPPAF